MSEQIKDLMVRIPRMANLTHLSYMDDTRKRYVSRIQTLETVPDSLKQVYSLFATAWQTESNAYKKSTRSVWTAQIHEWDGVRDNRLTAIRSMVQAYLHMSDTAKKQAAEVLQEVLTRYKVKTDAQLDLETQGITQLLEELERNYDVKQAVKTLGLTDTVTEMSEANEQVRKMIEDRQNEYSTRVEQELRTARKETDEAYARLVQMVNALAVTTADESGFSQYAAFIRVMNELIEHYVQSILPKGKKDGDSSDDDKKDDGGSDDGSSDDDDKKDDDGGSSEPEK